MRQALMLKSTILLILTFCFGLFCTSAAARTGYINDTLEITLRTGESTKNSIVRMLASGERINVISVNDDTGYAKVTTADGTEGYVLARFLTYQPIARDQLAAANRKAERSEQRIASLEAELRDIKGENTNYSQSQGQLESDNQRLNDELNDIRKTAANALQIAEENRSLKSSTMMLETEIEDLQARNSVLSERSRQSWFLAGAGTLIAGILAGLILPRIKFKRRSRWGDL